jgi:NAD(P)H-flavin reductase
MTAQRDRLLSALGHIVSHVDDREELVPYLEQLGRDHRRFGVADHHYPIVGRALLATLHRALGRAWTQRLASEWTAAYQLIADVMVDAAAKAATITPPWWEAQVVGVDRRCAQISVLTVAPSGHYAFLPGQSVAVEWQRRPRLWRYLSPANAPRADGSVDFHIRAVDGGQVSPALVYRCQAGDTLRLGPPVGVALTGYRHTSRPLLLIAGGTGLAPLRAILEDLATNRDARQVTLVVGAITSAELYDMPALQALEVMMPSLTVIAAVAKPPAGPAQPGSAVQVALRQRDWSGHDIYVCGSPNMVDGTRAALHQAGHPADQIITDQVGYREPRTDHPCPSDTRNRQ